MLVIPIFQRKKLRVCEVKYFAEVSQLVRGGSRIHTRMLPGTKSGSYPMGLLCSSLLRPIKMGGAVISYHLDENLSHIPTVSKRQLNVTPRCV